MAKHTFVNGKLVKVAKKWDDLKTNQKEEITTWFYEAFTSTCSIEDPLGANKNSQKAAVDAVLDKIRNADIWVPDHVIAEQYRSRLPRMRKRREAELFGNKE